MRPNRNDAEASMHRWEQGHLGRLFRSATSEAEEPL